MPECYIPQESDYSFGTFKGGDWASHKSNRFLEEYSIPALERGIRVVETAPPTGLKTPELLMVIESKKEEAHRLEVMWLESTPSVHGLRLIDSRGNPYDYLLMDARLPDERIDAVVQYIFYIRVGILDNGEKPDTAVKHD